MQKTIIDLNEVVKLTKDNKTPEEIAVILKTSGGVIRRRLKELNIEPYRKIIKKSSYILDQVKQLIEEGKTNKEIADILSISPTTIRKYTYELGYDTNSKKTKTLSNKKIEITELQWEILYGSLLGDMSIDINYKNARPIIGHGGDQEEYFDYKCEIFKNLIGKPNKTDRYDKRTNKWYHKYQVKFLTNPIYTELRKELYPNGIKTVTRNWLDKITPRGLAFWFMDDGSNCGTIATNSFSKSECQLIVNWFKEKWGIDCTLQSSNNNNNEQYLVYIRKHSRPIFYNLVHEYFIPSMLYKLENWNP